MATIAPCWSVRTRIEEVELNDGLSSSRCRCGRQRRPHGSSPAFVRGRLGCCRELVPLKSCFTSGPVGPGGMGAGGGGRGVHGVGDGQDQAVPGDGDGRGDCRIMVLFQLSFEGFHQATKSLYWCSPVSLGQSHGASLHGIGCRGFHHPLGSGGPSRWGRSNPRQCANCTLALKLSLALSWG